VSTYMPPKVEADSALVDKGPQKYFTISGHIYGDVDGVLVDTLNCHHCLTQEDQEQFANELARRYNSHVALVDGCNAVLGLIQLISHRKDLSPELRAVLTNNHRVQEAEATLKTMEGA
jgi:hypothetical protein